jgi:hypothetical protein
VATKVDIVVQLFFTLVFSAGSKSMKRKQCEKHATSQGSPSDVESELWCSVRRFWEPWKDIVLLRI